jgi:hypothetical protein
MGLPYGIIKQRQPELVASLPQAEAAAARQKAIWDRVVARAHRRSSPLRTAQEDTDDAEESRGERDAGSTDAQEGLSPPGQG